MAVVLEDLDQDLDIEFMPDMAASNVTVAAASYRYKPKHGQSRNVYSNPYRMNPFEVLKADFREARLYDDDIVEPGWRVQPYVANRKYRKWLHDARQQPGMRGLRRSFIPHDDEADENGNQRTATKNVSFVTRPQSISQSLPRGNRNGRLLPQSRVKGAKPGDDDFKAKMFTVTMGQEIATLRTAKKMTQADLAKKLNVDAPMIRNIEKGGLITFNSEDVMVKEMAKVLGVLSIKYQE